MPLGGWATEAGVSVGRPLEGRTVLIVEDDATIALDLALAFGKAGCTVLGPANTVAGAFALMADNRIDAVLLDVTLKRGELSFEVADALEALRVPFVFVSGHSTALMPPKHRDRLFFDKPYQSNEVVDALTRLLDGTGPVRMSVR